LEVCVTTSRIQLLSKGRRVPFLSAPDFSSADHPWAGYLMEESNGQNEPISRGSFLKTTLFLCTGGQGIAHRSHRGAWERNRIKPGSVFMVRRDTEIQAAWTTNSWPTLLLQIDNAKFQHVAPEEVRAVETSLVSALTTSDHRLAALMMAMRDEIRDGCASGRLYAESISLALLAYLSGRYATPTPRPLDNCDTSLSRGQRRKLVDYIRANLIGNISVTDLAELVQMSPAHFSRVFKASFGVTPYRYVMRERVEGAKAMLASAELSGSQVAIAFGFASQSHFVKVFRQFTGVTPKQYKASRRA
jgi:AraC family transcriptional regulator